MAKTIQIPYLNFSSNCSELLSTEIDELPRHLIDYNPWNYDFIGKVAFSIAYNDEAVFLKYYVSEENISAIFTKPNDPVYKDSCVEFFVAFNNETEYYNFEFNCKGTCLAGFGPYKENREFLKAECINKIKVTSNFITNNTKVKPLIDWELTLIIPITAFTHHNFDTLGNQSIKANFYKCGDDLPKPHYLCWNPILTDVPNFHVPEFFGDAIFAENLQLK